MLIPPREKVTICFSEFVLPQLCFRPLSPHNIFNLTSSSKSSDMKGQRLLVDQSRLVLIDIGSRCRVQHEEVSLAAGWLSIEPHTLAIVAWS